MKSILRILIFLNSFLFAQEIPKEFKNFKNLPSIAICYKNSDTYLGMLYVQSDVILNSFYVKKSDYLEHEFLLSLNFVSHFKTNSECLESFSDDKFAVFSRDLDRNIVSQINVFENCFLDVPYYDGNKVREIDYEKCGTLEKRKNNSVFYPIFSPIDDGPLVKSMDRIVKKRIRDEIEYFRKELRSLLKSKDSLVESFNKSKVKKGELDNFLNPSKKHLINELNSKGSTSINKCLLVEASANKRASCPFYIKIDDKGWDNLEGTGCLSYFTTDLLTVDHAQAVNKLIMLFKDGECGEYNWDNLQKLSQSLIFEMGDVSRKISGIKGQNQAIKCNSCSTRELTKMEFKDSTKVLTREEIDRTLDSYYLLEKMVLEILSNIDLYNEKLNILYKEQTDLYNRDFSNFLFD